jgi:hypothetical protein
MWLSTLLTSPSGVVLARGGKLFPMFGVASAFFATLSTHRVILLLAGKYRK